MVVTPEEAEKLSAAEKVLIKVIEKFIDGELKAKFNPHQRRGIEIDLNPSYGDFQKGYPGGARVDRVIDEIICMYVCWVVEKSIDPLVLTFYAISEDLEEPEEE